MAVRHMEISDLLVFKDKFVADFSNGINIIIGSNGTGKTTLMKAMYLACNLAKNRHNFIPADNEKVINETSGKTAIRGLLQFFSIDSYLPYITSANGTISWFANDDGTLIDKEEPLKLHFRYGANETTELAVYGIDGSNNLVYIPCNDMLSHSKGFISLYNERHIPFDKTYVDILSKAELTVTRKVTPVVSNLLNNIEEVIGGEVIHEDGIFFFLKENGIKIPAALEASGYRKLGLLWKLLRNGLLEPGTILFWDEPEDSLNPELVPILADILLELSRNGVQIFLATHDYMFGKYFEVRRKESDDIIFHSLYKSKGGIKFESNKNFRDLKENPIIAAYDKLLDEVIRLNMGD